MKGSSACGFRGNCWNARHLDYACNSSTLPRLPCPQNSTKRTPSAHWSNRSPSRKSRERKFFAPSRKVSDENEPDHNYPCAVLLFHASDPYAVCQRADSHHAAAQRTERSEDQPRHYW